MVISVTVTVNLNHTARRRLAQPDLILTISERRWRLKVALVSMSDGGRVARGDDYATT